MALKCQIFKDSKTDTIKLKTLKRLHIDANDNEKKDNLDKY